MDFFDNPYYRINKLFLSAVGVWPFQRRASKTFSLAFGIFGCANFFIPQVLYIAKCISDIDKLLSSLPTFFCGILITVKILTMIRNSAESRDLLNRIRDDWKSVTEDSEEWILRKYAANGRKFSVCYSILLTIPLIIYLLWPVAAPILDIILPLNESRPRVLPHGADYLVDEEKYYFVLLIMEYVGYLHVIVIIVGTDIMYTVCTEHVCGMFAVLSHRLENSVLKFSNDKHLRDHLIRCIHLHIETIIFVEMMTTIFTPFLLVDIILGLIMHCTACVMIVVRLNQPSEVALFGAIVFNQSVRLFFNCRPGQKLMDHSDKVATAIYNMMWYKISTRTRKMLILMMMRSQMSCMFVIAKFYVVNLNSFGVIMKTSLSYCTVMASVHDESYITED